MALIGDIRKRSGLLIVIIGVALAAFVLGDFFSPKNQHRSFNIGVIEGEEIPIQGFNQRFEENLNMRRQSQNQENITAQEQFNIRQSTWEELVREIVLGNNYSQIGLSISVDELDDLVRGPNPHNFIRQSFTDPQTGEFNQASVNNFLANLDKVDPAMKQRYLYIEKAIKNDQLSNKHRDLLIKAYHVPKILSEIDFRAKNRQADASVIAVRYQTIPDDEVSVSDQELKRFYENNKFRYTQEQSRSIDYVIFEIKASDDDREKISAEFNRLYEEFQQVSDVPLFVNTTSDSRYDSSWFRRGSLPLQIEEKLFDAPVGTIVSPFIENSKHIMAKLLASENRPDSLKASHILISYQGTGVNQQITRSRDDAKRMADSLFGEVQRNRRKFSELARSMSDDASAAQKDGDLGWFTDGAMVYPFNQAVLEGKVGDLVQVESQFGFHIVEITGKTAPVRKVRVAIINRIIEPSTRTIQETYVNASQFASTNRNAAAFEKALVDAGLSKRTASDIKPMDNNIPGISMPREIIRWMYNTSTKVGDVSPAFDVDGSFVIVTLTGINEKGTTPFERAKSLIEPLVRREKKAEILVKRFEEAAKQENNMQAIATKLSASVEEMPDLLFSMVNLPNYGREPKVVGEIFTLDENQMSKPIAGEMAVYLFRIEKYTVREPQEEDLKGIQRVLTNNFRSRATREATKVIEDNAKIEDNRMMFY